MDTINYENNPSLDIYRLFPPYLEANDAFVPLNNQQREILLLIDKGLHQHWKLGRQIMLSWASHTEGIDVLVVPYYLTEAILMSDNNKRASDNPDKESNYGQLLELIKGSRQLDLVTMKEIESTHKLYRARIKLPYPIDEYQLDTRLIDSIVKRYSVSYIENRAVALFDIVGFSRYTPFQQVTLINSLSYSINSAHNKLREKGINLRFAKTTTGDGFYIWNREPSVEDNINIYHMMHVVLADNAIAKTKSYGHTAPTLKTAFHVGSYYEFYQSEALHPTQYTYIVGDVTVELARMIEKALPGQIIMGDFNCQIPTSADEDVFIHVDTINFIKLLQDTLSGLRGLDLSNEGIESIKCYLTGQKKNDGFTISRYKLTDKHHYSRYVYNAKVNIYRDDDIPVFLGLQENDVSSPGMVRE